MYKIPKLNWEVTYVTTFDYIRKSWKCTNTFNDYYIQKENGLFYCYYGNGRYKEFNSLNEAKYWVEYVHYPTQVGKYLEKIDEE